MTLTPLFRNPFKAIRLPFWTGQTRIPAAPARIHSPKGSPFPNPRVRKRDPNSLLTKAGLAYCGDTRKSASEGF